MKIIKETKEVVYKINATKEEQAFCKQIIKLAQNVIEDETVSEYYRNKNNEDELLRNFFEDIADTGSIDLHDYE